MPMARCDIEYRWGERWQFTGAYPHREEACRVLAEIRKINPRGRYRIKCGRKVLLDTKSAP